MTGSRRNWVAAFYPLDLATGLEVPLYVSQYRFRTAPDDPLIPNEPFLTRLVTGPRIEQSLYASRDGRVELGGSSSLDPGSLEIVNEDRELNDWYGYSWDGRRAVVWDVLPGQTLAEAQKVFDGPIKDRTDAGRNHQINLRSSALLLDRPVQPPDLRPSLQSASAQLRRWILAAC